MWAGENENGVLLIIKYISQSVPMFLACGYAGIDDTFCQLEPRGPLRVIHKTISLFNNIPFVCTRRGKALLNIIIL